MTGTDDDQLPDSNEIIKSPPRAGGKRGNPAWQKGGPSPNPGGRPRRERECAQILDQWVPEVLRMLARKAVEEGDVAAARVIVQAGLPPARAAIAQLDLGPLRTVAGCQRAIARISEAVAWGLIAPPDAAPFLALVAAASKQIELGDIADRLAAIERILAAAPEA